MTTLGGIELPEDMEWTNRYQYTSIVQDRTFALSGTQHINESQQLGGRPITLESEENAGLMTKSVLDQLLALTETPGQELVLNYYGQTFNVVLDRDKGGIEAKPLWRFVDPISTDDYIVKIHLIEVST